MAYSHWRDSRRLKVVAKADMRIMGGDYDEDKIYVMIEVVNVGRRPITLNPMPYFEPNERGAESYIFKSRWEPRDRLEEGESTTMIGFQDGLPLDKIRRLVVRDVAGRKWHGKIVRSA